MYLATIIRIFTIYGSIVLCPDLTQPNNGTINCSLGDDGVPSYEDICSFTCNTDYELTGNSSRFCESDGTWAGNEAVCNISRPHNLCIAS